MGRISQWFGQVGTKLKAMPSSKGQQAEAIAAQYLKRKGLTLVQQNYRTPLGEIDLICQDQQQLVFVEVRYKAGSDPLISPAETITRSKQLKVIKAARHYLQRHDPAGHLSCRFDVVAMTGQLSDPQIDWLPHAFY